MSETEFGGNGEVRTLQAATRCAPMPWHKSAPARLREAPPRQAWQRWVEYLDRKKRAEHQAMLDGQAPLAWGLSEGQAATTAAQRGAAFAPASCKAGRRQRLDAWLAEPGGNADAGYCLEALAWCRAMPRLAQSLPPDTWWAALRHLVEVADEARSVEPSTGPLVFQLGAGELAWTLACLFPEVKACRRLARPARRALSSALEDLCEKQGLLHGRHFAAFPALLASWTRCLELGAHVQHRPWDRQAERRFRRVVRSALRMARRDGSPAFSNGTAGRHGLAILEKAVHLAGDADDRRLAAWTLAGKGQSGRSAHKAFDRRSKRVLAKARLPAVHSEWAAAAVLRRDWSPDSERLAVIYAGREVRSELVAGRDVLWSGRWDLEIRVDGRRAAPVSDWREAVWFSDEDVDYLEVEADFEHGLIVQRHLLLARDDGFLIAADSVMGTEPRRIEYCGRLPLAAAVRFAPAEESHEGYLCTRKRRALVLPLALPEWRVEPDPGRLCQESAGLALRHSIEGCSLMAPLFFDLDPKRLRRPCTWRRLTVAEALQIVPRDVAVGYRVAVDRQQWLLYRSLAARGNRTVLGQNYAAEMVVGRFTRSGECEQFVELE